VPTAKPTPEPSIQAGVGLTVAVFTFDMVSVDGNPFVIMRYLMMILIYAAFMHFRT
jgi:hypothetical protein